MITPSDTEYKATKQIMLGKSNIDPDFQKLADFIDQEFGVRTINIIYDTFGKEKRPRLNICFEFTWESQSFNEIAGNMNFDSKKQQLIANRFKQSLEKQGVRKKKGLMGWLSGSVPTKYKTDHVWVCYSAFEPIARIANEKIPENKIIELKEELGNKDLWEISRAFSGVTFFLFTDEQVKQYELSETQRHWADRYFDLLEPYNEFGYFKRDSFNICLDSKQNLDANYEGNWFYYYR